MIDYRKQEDNVFESTINAKNRADKLNKFSRRIDTQDFLDKIKQSRTFSLDDLLISIGQHEVCSSFVSVNPRKASGPDGICGRVL